MKSKMNRPIGRFFYFPLLIALIVLWNAGTSMAATPAKTTVQDTVYRADGTVAQGTLLISWPAFTSAGGDAVAAGLMNVKIPANGVVNIALVPNTGSNPASSYKVTLRASDGTVSEEFWTVPATGTTTIGAIRSKLMPTVAAQQFVGRDYVDTKLAGLDASAVVHLSGNETVSGVKSFTFSPKVPAPASMDDAATKKYVDDQTSTLLSGAGSYADPAWLTSLAAAKLSGTLADASLPASVPRLASANTWTSAQKSYSGSPSQANNGLSSRLPRNLDIEAGSAAVPTVNKYQTSPNLYVSDYGNTDASNCVTGMAAPCASPMVMIEGTNQSATTTADLTGVIVNLWGAKGNTSASGWGNQWIGGAFQMYDSPTPNVVSMTGLNPNITSISTPVGCFKGNPGDSTCARTMNGMEIDSTNSTSADGVFEQSVGNMINGAAINCYASNASPKDCSYGLTIGTGTTGHGWKIGQVIGGAQNVGLLIPQAQISLKPDIALHIASQGSYGLVVGTGSTTYSHGSAQTLGNPTNGILLDAQRVEGNTSAVQSNTIVFRAATGAATYANWKEYIDNAGNTHFQTDKSGSFADFMTMNPNATPANSSLVLTGQLFAGSAINFKYAGGNYFTLTGTPTAAGRTWTFQDASGVVVGRDTTDTLTNKTLDTAGSGNVLKISGTQLSAVTGTGAVVLATNASIIGATLTTPNIGVATGTSLDLGKVTLDANGKLTKYGNIAVTGTGLGPIYGSVSLTAQGAAISATNLYTATAGLYRVCYDVQVTRAATTSSSVGVTIGWNNGGAQTKSSTAVASNVLNAEDGNCYVVYSTASNITYATTYASSGGTSMQYALRVTAEQLQ